MGSVWAADDVVFNIVEKVQGQYHVPRLSAARIAVSFVDSKAFARGRFNWGKTSKFNNAAKIWHPADKRYDFNVALSSEVWAMLNGDQKEALIDLHLSCCQVEYEPETVMINGKKKPKKDEWGRTIYSNVIKADKDGDPKWKLGRLDLTTFQDNVIRFGCWCQDLMDLKTTIKEVEAKEGHE